MGGGKEEAWTKRLRSGLVTILTELPDSVTGLALYGIWNAHLCSARTLHCDTSRSSQRRCCVFCVGDFRRFERSLCLNLQAQISSFFTERKATRTFETSRTSYQATRRHTPQDSNPQQNCCTKRSHIPFPFPRVNFQHHQRVIWQ